MVCVSRSGRVECWWLHAAGEVCGSVCIPPTPLVARASTGVVVRFITVDVADAVTSWVVAVFFYVSERCYSCPSFSSGISDGCNTEGSGGFWFLVFLGVTNLVLPCWLTPLCQGELQILVFLGVTIPV